MKSAIDPRLLEELKSILEAGIVQGEVPSPERIEKQTSLFADHFGPKVLESTDGVALLQLMHGRKEVESRCLAYWLEFKDDEDFAGRSFGGIGGGSALKFGIYQRDNDGAWIGGSSRAMEVLSLEKAIAKARQQRDELLAGDKALAEMSPTDTSDEAYAELQKRISTAAPQLSGVGWAHKYWFLLHRDRLDDYHAPNYQRYQLFKLLRRCPVAC
jgi:5-methylcytosine-specific restriction enzyme B